MKTGRRVPLPLFLQKPRFWINIHPSKLFHYQSFRFWLIPSLNVTLFAAEVVRTASTAFATNRRDRMKFLRFFAVSAFIITLTAFSVAAATFTVTKIEDTNDGVCDADCSFREAVGAANAAVGDDIIDFSSLFDTPQTIVLSLGEINISATGALTINGPGAQNLTLDGNLTSRIITMSAGSTVSIDGVRLTRGNGVSATNINTNTGGAIHVNGGALTITNSIITANQTTGVSGGIRNSGTGSTLTLINCIVSNNTSGSSGAGVQSFNTSTVVVIGSTFSGNTSTGGAGGGMMVAGVGHVINSTFTGNTNNGTSGGGITSTGTQPFIMTNSTIVGNTSVANAGGFHRGSTNPSGFIRNSIIAGNTGPGGDVTNSDGGIQSQGNNIIGAVGTSTGWVKSDLLNTNPMLGPLGDNGGFGQTFVPMPGSPAIDGGQNCVVDASCSANNPIINVATDQRGIARPQGANVDIGSVEVVGTAPSSATIIGRVFTPNGLPIKVAIVTMTPAPTISNGIPVPAYRDLTSNLGYFSFGGVPTGQSYQVNVSAKGWTFAPQIINVTGDITDLEITATGEAVQEER